MGSSQILLTKVEPSDVNGAVTGSAIVDIPTPSEWSWSLKDISSPKAGRTADMRMVKMRLGQMRTIALSWQGLSYDEGAKVIEAFNAEYFWLTYFDAFSNKQERRRFYRGDVTTASYSAVLKRYKNISFELIQAEEG